MTKFGTVIILLYIVKTSAWFLCPPSSGCGPMPVTSPCCTQQTYTPSQPCCNQQIPSANNCNGCSSNVNYPQAQVYQSHPYLQPQQIPQQIPQQMYQVPPAINQQQQPQIQYPIQNTQFYSEQKYNVIPKDNGYIQPNTYVTPNPCYQIGKHRCCNQKLQFEMENFLEDYQNTGASMCNYNRLAKEMQHRLETNFNVTFETVVSLGDFESKSYYEGYQVCKFERRGKTYMAYETPFENPGDMIAALEKDLGHPINGNGYKQNNFSNMNIPETNMANGKENFEFGTSDSVNGGRFQVTDIGTPSHTQQRSMFTKSRM